MKKNLVKVLTGMAMATLFAGNVEAKEIETGNNVLMAAKIIDIEYSKNENEFDEMYFRIDGNVYVHYDYAEDMLVGDDVLMIVDTKGTEDYNDDVIIDWICWNPEF